jgi:hypothetical protein
VVIVGLAFQVVGILVAGVALLLEWRADAHLEPSRLSPPDERPTNPYAVPLKTRFRKASSRDRQAYRRALTGQGALIPGVDDVGDDPDVVAAFRWLTESQVERRRILARDWETQRLQVEETRAELRRLFDEQSQLLVTQQRDSRRRVRAEGAGLILAMVGTIISGVAGM